MRRSLLWSSLLLCLPALTSACRGTTISNVTEPSAGKCQPALSGLPQSVDSSGGRLSLSVTTTRDCAWSLTTEDGWVQVSPGAGQGEASVSLTVAENPAGASRSAGLTLNDRRVTLTQAPAPCRFTVAPSSVTVAAAGGRVEISVNGPSGCGWTARSAQSWIRLSPAQGAGAANVEVVIAESVDKGIRRGAVAIAGIAVPVEQLGLPDPVPAPAPEPGPSPSPTPPAPAPTPAPEPAPGPAPAPEPVPAPTPTTITGKVENLLGICPLITFTLDGRLVVTTAVTRFGREGCREIDNGDLLEVEGGLQSPSVIVATRIRVRR